jgi:hypothetical protein
MHYKVTPFESIDREAYLDLLQDCRGSSPFNSLDWMKIYELFSSGVRQFLICAHEGDCLFAAMPVTVFEKFFVHAVFSSGFGVHGGPICRPGHEDKAIPGLLEAFVREFGGFRTVLLSVQDFAGLASSLRALGLKETVVSTHVLPLPDCFDKLDKKVRTFCGYATRKAAKAGIEIYRSRDPGDFEQWQHLCSKNYIAHGRRPYPAALYRAVAQLLPKSDTFRFYVAKLNGRVVAGSVQVFGSRQVYGWLNARDSEFDSYRVNDAVVQTVFQDAIADGMVSFDLGPSPGGAKGVVGFKEKWGGIQKDYYQYSWTSVLGRIGANLVRYGRVLPTQRNGS